VACPAAHSDVHSPCSAAALRRRVRATAPQRSAGQRRHLITQQLPHLLRPHPRATLQAERHMRGIADTAYVLHEWRSAPLSLRKLVMLFACLEAHLIPVVTLTSLVILPVYYNLFMLATTGGVARPSTLPVPMRVLAGLGQANLSIVLVVLVCYELLRSIVRRHVYRLMDNDKHERCWWNCPRFLLHCLNYLTLFVSVWVYTVVPVVLVVGKHMFNVRSTTYVVADKRIPTTTL
jgi:hypothetical protein